MTVMEKSEYYKIIYDILKNEEFQKRKYYDKNHIQTNIKSKVEYAEYD